MPCHAMSLWLVLLLFVEAVAVLIVFIASALVQHVLQRSLWLCLRFGVSFIYLSIFVQLVYNKKKIEMSLSAISTQLWTYLFLG